MTDAWQGYPCRIGSHPGFVTYNHSAAQRLAQLPFPFFAGFRVAFDAPEEDGFPPTSEHERLRELEVFLASRFSPDDALMVGRTTTNGERYFQFYTRLARAACKAIADRAWDLTGYEVAIAHEEDPARTTYWKELYPDEDGWQAIRDRSLERALQDAGDPLTEAREILHWAWFGSADARAAFLAAVAPLADLVAESEIPEGRFRFSAKLRHHGLPDSVSVHRVTLGLSRAARANGGEYDGWEAQVCGPAGGDAEPATAAGAGGRGP